MKANFKLLCAVIMMIILCYSLAFINEFRNQKLYVNASTITSKDKQSKIAPSNTQTIIMLDAGHGGYDSGSIGINGTLEKDITLIITLNVGYYLREAGYDVVYTRESDDVTWESDNLIDLQTRIDLAMQANASYFISLHTNYSNYNDGAYGFESFLDYENDTIEQMASTIHEQLSSLNYSIDRGLKDTDTSSLYVIDQNPIPALLLEIGFLSDSDDASYIEQNPVNIAKAIANGIIKTLEK